MRAIWCAIGFAFAICVMMCAVRDEQGDEQDAWAWAGACIGLVAQLMGVGHCGSRVGLYFVGLGRMMAVARGLRAYKAVCVAVQMCAHERHTVNHCH